MNRGVGLVRHEGMQRRAQRIRRQIGTGASGHHAGCRQQCPPTLSIETVPGTDLRRGRQFVTTLAVQGMGWKAGREIDAANSLTSSTNCVSPPTTLS